MTDYSGDIKETKKNYVFDYEGNDDVSIRPFVPDKKKPMNVTLNNLDNTGHNFFSSLNYSETITVTGGHYSLYLAGGNSNKTVKLGDTKGNNVHISNIGKNKITAGNEGNNFSTNNPYSNNTITAGTGKDQYTLKSGITKITDKGGIDRYDITGGFNTITDKGNDDNIFNANTTSGMSDGGTTTIKSGDGSDSLNVYNDVAPTSGELIINADLGKGDDKVIVDYDEDSTQKINASIVNVKTGKGEDKVDIKAGKKNTIDTGDDIDKITVYNTAVNTISTIKAGAGNDIITINDGKNTIYGGKGEDNITLNGGINVVYGGGDKITATDGLNTIYANADKNITLLGGANTVNISKDKNTIDVTGGTDNTINLKKGNNTVNTSGEGSRATVNIAAGKNTVNIGGTSLIQVNSTTKTTQTLNIKDNAFCGATLGKGNDIIYNSSASDDSNIIKAGAGNDRVYISEGKKKVEGENGNDYFELSGGSGHAVDGGDGKDTFDVKGASSCSISGGTGNDTFNIKSGTISSIQGGDNNDTFNIEGGVSGVGSIHGDNGNVIFNFKGGYVGYVFGGEGNDTYNIYKGAVGSITDDNGTNSYNVKKGFEGSLAIKDSTTTSKVVLDKSYKLSKSTTTDMSTVSVYGNIDKSANCNDFRLVFDFNNEIENKTLYDNVIMVNNQNNMKYTVGGKNYSLDISDLTSAVAGWLSSSQATYGTDFNNTDAVFASDNASAIASLAQVFTENSAGCFK